MSNHTAIAVDVAKAVFEVAISEPPNGCGLAAALHQWRPPGGAHGQGLRPCTPVNAVT